MDLQTTFYIIGIIFMSLMLLIMLALVIVLIIIKKKINDIHYRIEEKLAIFHKVADLGTNIATAAKKVVGRK